MSANLVLLGPGVRTDLICYLNCSEYFPEPLFIKGTPPEGFLKEQKSQPFEVTHLSAGTYRLYNVSNAYGVKPGLPKPDPVLLKTFELRDGEELHLGTINAKFHRVAPAKADDIGSDKLME